MQTEIAFNPFDPEFRADPYPTYHALRARDPVLYSEILNTWILTSYDDCVFVLRDPRFSADRTKAENFISRLRPGIDPEDIPRSMLNSDPPDHTRLRTLVSKAFTARHVEALRPRVHEIVDTLLDELAQRGEMDVIADYAYPIPVTVIAEMLGVPPSDREVFQRWTNAIARILDPLPDPQTQQRAFDAREHLLEYFSGIVAERRKAPRDDLISAMIAAEEQGDALTTDELLNMCNLLLIAGHETTVNLIGNGLLALLRHPEAMARFREDPGLDRSAVEELLRFDGPVQLTGRVATEPIEIGGKTVRPRQAVITLIGAANRDPAAFDAPDELRLDRHPNANLAFGAGIHYCLGAPLARLEGQVALGSLVRRFPKLELATDAPEWRGTLVLRGLERLPVTW